jgi:hypothetical protein
VVILAWDLKSSFKTPNYGDGWSHIQIPSFLLLVKRDLSMHRFDDDNSREFPSSKKHALSPVEGRG